LYVVAGFSRPFSVRLKADTTYNRKTLYANPVGILRP
jgi:hypothetical protein